jgi:hypothetical protein
VHSSNAHKCATMANTEEADNVRALRALRTRGDILVCGSSIGTTNRENDSDEKATPETVAVTVTASGLSLGLLGDAFSVAVQDKEKIAPSVATGLRGALKSKAAMNKARPIRRLTKNRGTVPLSIAEGTSSCYKSELPRDKSKHNI